VKTLVITGATDGMGRALAEPRPRPVIVNVSGPGVHVSYVLLNPGAVATSFSGQYDTATAAHVERLNATPSAEHVLHHQFYRHPAVRHARTGRATSREPAVIRGAVAPSR
jgi:short-subunit dehydrogenase